MPKCRYLEEVKYESLYANCTGLDIVDHKIDAQIKLNSMKRQVKSLPLIFQKIFMVMFYSNKPFSQRIIAQKVKCSRHVVRKALEVFRQWT